MTASELISDHFDRVAARAGDRIAIHEGNRQLSFGGLLEWSHVITRILAPLVREPGVRVALLLPNSATFVASFYGALRAGTVVAPLNPRYRSQELEYYLRDLDPAALVTDPAAIPLVQEVLSQLSRPPALLAASANGDISLVRQGCAEHRAISQAESAPLLQQYTSGSTGRPKAVVRTHAALLRELEALQRVFQTGESDRFLGAAPFSHVNGLVRTMMASMHVGATLYPVEEFHRRDVLDLITREGVTVFGGVPQMFNLLGQTPRRGPVDLSSLRVLFSSSAPLLPDDNHRFFGRYGMFVRQLYGSTETGTISVACESNAESLTSVGAPLPGVMVEVVDSTGARVARGEEGEIWIASVFSATSYLDNLTATEKSFEGEFYRSGDLGTMDSKGNITIRGRRSLVINRGGFKVHPYEVEEAIARHPSVREVAVYGAPSLHGDDVVCCCIVLSAECSAEEILRHCQGRIASYKMPSRIEFRTSLPKTLTGKILRVSL
jgi:long-chain acyl-CoA synthetase